MEELGITNLHLQVVSYRNLLWGGFQGCLRYKEGELQYSEQEAELFSEKFPRVDVLLLHAPPLGLLDAEDPVHVGSPAIRKYIEKNKPRFVFCGHLYSTAELEHQGTKIIRGYNAMIHELPL